MADNTTYSDSTGRAEVTRYKSLRTGQWMWSLRVDSAWLGHFSSGLVGVARYAAGYMKHGARPISEATILAEINEDLVRKCLTRNN